jgi:hypothetical protein
MINNLEFCHCHPMRRQLRDSSRAGRRSPDSTGGAPRKDAACDATGPASAQRGSARPTLPASSETGEDAARDAIGSSSPGDVARRGR